METSVGNASGLEAVQSCNRISCWPPFDSKEVEFEKALKSAADSGAPIILSFVRSGQQSSQELSGLVMPALKARFGPIAIFVLVEVASLCGRRLAQQFSTDLQCPYTLVLGIRHGSDGALLAYEPVMHRFVGSNERFISNHIAKLLPLAEQAMRRNGFPSRIGGNCAWHASGFDSKIQEEADLGKAQGAWVAFQGFASRLHQGVLARARQLLPEEEMR